jgi:hypothetical protein
MRYCYNFQVLWNVTNINHPCKLQEFKPSIEIAGQTMYVYRIIEPRSCNHCCSGKAIHIIYCECVFVALCI